MENEITIEEVKEYLDKINEQLKSKVNKACLNQMQQKREDIELLDSTAVELAKLSGLLVIYSSKITKLTKRLSLTRNLWCDVNGIGGEDLKKLEENSEKFFKETAENFAKEILK